MLTAISTTGWIVVPCAIAAAAVVCFLLLKKKPAANLVYQWDGWVVAGKEKEQLPADILAAMREANSPYVCCSEIILWNAGEHPIRGSDIDPAEPLRISTPMTSKILRIARRSATSDAMAFTVNQDRDHPNVAFCDFDFLAPGEGVRLQIYQTGVLYAANPMTGKVRGQRDNILNWGRVPIGNASDVTAPWMLRYAPLMCALLVMLVIVVIPAAVFVKYARHGHDPDFQLFTLGDGMRIGYWVLFSLFQVRVTMAQYRTRFGRYPRSLAES